MKSAPKAPPQATEAADSRTADQRGRGISGFLYRLWELMGRHPVLTVLIVALLARVVAATAIHAVIGTHYFGVLDDTTYSGMSQAVAEGRTDTWDEYTQWLYNSTAAFTLPLTLVYLVFGPVVLGGPLVAALFGAVAAALTARLAMEALPAGWALATGLGVALFPSQVLWSSMTLKDAPVWAVLVLLAVILAIGNRVLGWRLAASWAGAAVALLLLGHLRMHTLVVAAWAFGIAAWFGRREQRGPRIAGAVVVAVLLPWALGLGPAGLSLVVSAGQDLESRRIANAFGAATALIPDAPVEEELESDESVAKELEQIDEEIAQTQAELEVTTDPQARRELEARLDELVQRRARVQDLGAEEAFHPDLAHLPRGLSAMLLEPYPWRSPENQRVAIARLESFVWYPLLVLALAGLLALRRRAGVLVYPVLAGGAILLMYALAEGNFGTAYRHRGEFVWVVMLLAAVGLHRLWERRSEQEPVG